MVKTGLSRLRDDFPEELKGKNVALLAHAASVDEYYRHAIDIIKDSPANLVAIFGPQHGLHGQTQDNMIEWHGSEKVGGDRSIPLYSLYGTHRRPTPEMLQGVDAFIVDLQDVGARPYTYIWTIKEIMAAIDGSSISLWVLDRPNPVSYLGLDGATLDSSLFTFVGGAEIPLAHAMTMGEMALWVQRKYYPSVDLHIHKMLGWNRMMSFSDTALPWVLPSPNMPSERTAVVYPGMVLFETVTVSEGRGTTTPFELFGDPSIDPCIFEEIFRSANLPDVVLRRHDFIPTFHKHCGKECAGWFIHPIGRGFKPVATASVLLQASYHALSSGEFFKSPPYEYEYNSMPIDIVSGNSSLREWIESKESIGHLQEEWRGSYGSFIEEFEKVRLYEGGLL